MEEVKAVRIIPDLTGELVGQARVQLKKKLDSSNPKPAGEFKGEPWFVLGDNQNGYVVLVSSKSGEIIYFVRFVKKSIFSNQLGRQVLLWRSKEADEDGHVAAAGFARYVFFRYLLPKFGALISDTQQTGRGRDFWDYALETAFEESKFVYMLQAKPRVLVLLSSLADVKANAKTIWGYIPDHEKTGIIISTKPLRLSKQATHAS